MNCNKKKQKKTIKSITAGVESLKEIQPQQVARSMVMPTLISRHSWWSERSRAINLSSGARGALSGREFH